MNINSSFFTKQRYQANWADLWLIDTHNGWDNIAPVNVSEYPGIKHHLDQYYEKISKRQDRGITPYNLRNCAYHEHFS
ncbi:MAG: hypothetical protein OXE59_12485, partial [Bacteroidetes bacterium]|nr:hypothetical protein [Bacteroidota bacterium]